MGSRDAGKSLVWPIYGVKIAFLGSGDRFPGGPSQPFGNRMAKDHLVGIFVWAFFRASALILSRRCSNCFWESLVLKTKQPAGSGGLFRFWFHPMVLVEPIGERLAYLIRHNNLIGVVLVGGFGLHNLPLSDFSFRALGFGARDDR